MRLVTTLLIVSTVLVLVNCQAALARTWHIEPDGSGDVTNIQDAIASASPGDTVLLAAGVYTGPGNTNVDFMGMEITVTSVYGADFTTINCENTSRGFLFQTNEGPSTVLTGVTISNGFDNFSGGAIFCRSASPTIIRNTLIGNQTAFQGGAIYCDSSSAVVTQNRFIQNGAVEGGGLWCSGLSDITVTSNIFSENQASNGGGIACNASSPLIADNTFEDNVAVFGGAIDVLAGSQPTIRQNTFLQNGAQSRGGAIRCRQSPPPEQSAVFSDNIFVYNGAVFGGAIYCEDISSPTISNNTFDGNQAGSGAGIYCTNFSDPQILNNIIVNSTGGAIASANNSKPLIACCDVAVAGLPSPADYVDGGGNFFADPNFCHPLSGNYYLRSDSPCAADSQPVCGLIGARFVGCTIVTGVDDTPRGRTSLGQNFPNPFNPVTTIAFELPEQAGRVTLRVFDVEGGLVRTLVDERRRAGRNFVTWDGANDAGAQVASGVYFYHLRTSGYRETLKMVLLK